MAEENRQTQLAADDIHMAFPLPGKKSLTALCGVSLVLGDSTTKALVGESGCGKSTLAKILLRLNRPTSGTVTFRGKNLWEMGREPFGDYRRSVQLIFQDPYSSLNPRMKVGDIVGEPLLIHKICPKDQIPGKVEELLNRVGLNQTAYHRYPREFSGGQRQRIGIARALAAGPKILIADEPVSALDVSVQAQVLNLLSEIKKEENLSMLFISHDLRVVRSIADSVAVMYLGYLVEEAPTKALYETPQHPYTKMLLASVPEPDPKKRKAHIPVTGDPPSPVNRPQGCPFHPRCPSVMDICKTLMPGETVAEGRRVRCYLYGG